MLPEDKERELEDLVAFVESPGWARFCAHVASEFGAKAYREKAQRILGSVTAAQPQDAALHLLQLEASAREVEKIMSWPRERIQKLQNLEDHAR